MTNEKDRIDFPPTCPNCGATDHKMYNYKGETLLACPSVRGDNIYLYDYSGLMTTSEQKIRNLQAMNEWDKQAKPRDDVYLSGLGEEIKHNDGTGQLGPVSNKPQTLVATMRVPYDNEIGGGWGPFKISIPQFEECFAYHDLGYSDLIAGTSLITLKELDRRFLANMLKKAAAEAWLYKDPALGVSLTRKAWLCYRVARLWATTVRRELEEFRPRQKKN